MPVSWKKIVTKQTLLEPLVWTLNKKIRNYYPFGELKKYVFLAILGKSANYQESLYRIVNNINNFFAIPLRTKILVAKKLFSSMRNRMKTFSMSSDH